MGWFSDRNKRIEEERAAEKQLIADTLAQFPVGKEFTFLGVRCAVMRHVFWTVEDWPPDIVYVFRNNDGKLCENRFNLNQAKVFIK